MLDEPPPRVILPLKLKIERADSVRDEELPALEKELLDRMHRLLKNPSGHHSAQTKPPGPRRQEDPAP